MCATSKLRFTRSAGCAIRLLLPIFSVTAVASIPNATNVIYTRGGNVTLVCPSTVTIVSVQWSYIPAKCTGRNDNFLQLPTNEADSRFRSENLKNGSSLSINQIDLRDAGIYKCLIDTNNTDADDSPEMTFHLIVIDSKLTCEANRNIVYENDTAKLKCSVTYCGHTDPVIEWSQRDKDKEQIIIVDNMTKLNQYAIGKTLISSLTIRASDQRDLLTFTCRTDFNQSPGMNYNFASKHKLYNDTCEPGPIRVLYGSRNVTIEPRRDEFVPGDILTCSALGNPEPSFEWKNNETGKVTAGPQLTIVDSMRSTQRYVFRCTANNTISSSFSEIEFTVDSNLVKRRIVIIIAASAGLVILMVLIVIIFVYNKRRKSELRRKSLEVREYAEISYSEAVSSRCVQTREAQLDPLYSSVHHQFNNQCSVRRSTQVSTIPCNLPDEQELMAKILTRMKPLIANVNAA